MPPANESAVPLGQAALAARTASAATLRTLLQNSRTRTLTLLESYRAALGNALTVPQSATLNPPLWELGHIAWFQDYWLSRNPERARGPRATLKQPRLTSRLAQADALYDSGRVAQMSRWQLPLPDLAATLRYAEDTLEDSLDLLQSPAMDSDDALYFFRLVLFHEDMHSEAWIYTAQALGLDIPDAVLHHRCSAQPVTIAQVSDLHLPAGLWQTGWQDAGFAFDNELGSHSLELAACDIDNEPVTWQRYLPFVEANGYHDQHWWSPAGWQWLQAQAQVAPRYLRPGPATGAWRCRQGSQWQPLNPQAAAVHLSYFEAQAWCNWADRALPSEAQWERAALQHPAFRWGQVWEWTASTFAPYPGFVAHPYRDYSAPWFDGRPVLKGASSATHDRMAHPRYRNFFEPQRNDVPTGFRSCKK